MNKICFFNHFHNGDIFHSKSFIEEIINSIDADFSYAHSNHSNLLKDLNIKHQSIPDISCTTKFLELDGILYVNTWIGSYFVKGEKYYGECTLRFSYEMFSKIYDELNKRLGCELKLSSIEKYIPNIKFSEFNILNIESYIQQDLNKKILFCNGPCLSGQCAYHGDMQPIINSLAGKYPNITFIVTHRISTDLQNIKYTGDLIDSSEGDLNEIGYLSTFCDIIIGRNSGPFCFSTNKRNVDNSKITFYAFGEDVLTCFLYEIDLDCSFIFEYFNGLENLETSIDKLILEL